ncbi:hypothetical protein E0Z10_g7165 [Xylaria hypoxylon]|uniref:Rhodopsin domain-containing protein n=1 Tax=Xylaria hypoxylon TaxID=37992 RepID=A0A4Z0YRA7_9PEZI|nr:hypothetical protein E0Z10_g7165 [Xylaria hypoxylon]
MEGTHGLSKGTIDALKALFVILAFIAVVLRLVANWKYNRKLLVDDYISISAIPFLISVAVLSDLAGNGFHDPDSSPYRIAQLAVSISVFTPLALWTCKAPILFLYIRLFGVKKWLRITSYVTLGFTAAVYASGIIAIPPACTPHTTNLSDAFIDGCQTRTRMINVYLGGTSVFADVIILVLPMPVVFGLKLLIRSRIGLVFLFLSGLFAIGASVISLVFKAVSLTSPTTSLALSILATITECSVALIVGCVPSLRVLWSKILKPSVKSSRGLTTTDPTGNRTNRGTSHYMVVGEGTDRKPPGSNAALVVSTEVHTSTSTVADYQQQQQQQQNQGPQQVYGQPYYGRPSDGPFGEVQPPFGVYTEAYALQTRHQGVWGR